MLQKFEITVTPCDAVPWHHLILRQFGSKLPQPHFGKRGASFLSLVECAMYVAAKDYELTLSNLPLASPTPSPAFPSAVFLFLLLEGRVIVNTSENNDLALADLF